MTRNFSLCVISCDSDPLDSGDGVCHCVSTVRVEKMEKKKRNFLSTVEKGREGLGGHVM